MSDQIERRREADAERALIGGCLLDGNAYARIKDIIQAEHLVESRHRAIFAAFTAVDARSEPPDAVLVAAELEHRGELALAGGREYLSELLEETASASNVAAYARVVRAAAERAAERLNVIRPQSEPAVSAGPDGAVVHLLPASSIKPRPIGWEWEGWLARGKLHVFAGAPGAGKTTVAMSFAATKSSGGRWPDGSKAKPGAALIWSGEDDPADTLQPRLIAMGADLERCYFVDEVTTANDRRPFDPATDMPALLAAVAKIGSVDLLIVDPVVNAVTGDSHKNTETRRALQPLVDLAAALDAAVLGISHYTKGTAGRDPVERVTGSVAFGALPRVILGAAKNADTGARILVRAKSNIGPDGGGYEYELRQNELERYPGIVASGVLWGEAIEGGARELLAATEAEPDDEEQTALDEAEAFLREELEGGRVRSKDIIRSARDAGITQRTLERARKSLKVRAERVQELGGSAWYLSLPPDQDRQAASQVRHPSTPGGLGGLGGLELDQGVSDRQDRQNIQDRQDRHDSEVGSPAQNVEVF